MRCWRFSLEVSREFRVFLQLCTISDIQRLVRRWLSSRNALGFTFVQALFTSCTLLWRVHLVGQYRIRQSDHLTLVAAYGPLASRS
eukprot:g4445.t1